MNIDPQTLAQQAWALVQQLPKRFKHTEYANILIPSILIRRLESQLADTRSDVNQFYTHEKDSGLDLEITLPHISRYPFYNTSQLTLETLGSTHTGDNLIQYTLEFSNNVKSILQTFNFQQTVRQLSDAGALYQFIQGVIALPIGIEDLSPQDSIDMIKQVMKLNAASINEKPADSTTPNDISTLMARLVIEGDQQHRQNDNAIVSLYDPACGLLGLLFEGSATIHNINQDLQTVFYGQDRDEKTHALASTLMLIKGIDPSTIRCDDTLTKDHYVTRRFDYILSNPSFGDSWDKQAPQIINERSQSDAGRFSPGLPRTSDSSMLFIMQALARLKSTDEGGGRIGIIMSGSPMYTGGVDSGESKIRRWLFENDYVESIIALPSDMFINSSIGGYIWILSNRKPATRQGEVQLLDLSQTYTAMPRPENKKRRYWTEHQINSIVDFYQLEAETRLSKWVKNEDFGYRKVFFDRPLRGIININQARIDSLLATTSFSKLTAVQQEEIVEALLNHQTQMPYHEFESFCDSVSGLARLGKRLVGVLKNHFFQQDDSADLLLDADGFMIMDKKKRNHELIPMNDTIGDYLEAHLFPFLPDAVIDNRVTDEQDQTLGLVGYEVHFNRYFSSPKTEESLETMRQSLSQARSEINQLMNELGI